MEVEAFLSRDVALVSSLPQMSPLASSMSQLPAMPTALDMDVCLQSLRVCALEDARARYETVPLSAEYVDPVLYVAPAAIGSSSAAVVEIKRREGVPVPMLFANNKRGFVDKVAVLERVPDSAAGALRALIEMLASVKATHTPDMVSLPAVRRATAILRSYARAECAFSCADAAVPLLPTEKDRADAIAKPSADAKLDDGVEREQCYDPTGEAYFILDPDMAAVRLYCLLKDLKRVPSGSSLLLSEWEEQVDSAFALLLRDAAMVGVTPETVFNFPPPRGPRAYGHARNAEHINEVVGGARAALLYHAGTTVAITPLIDHFAFDASTGEPRAMGAPSDRVALHVIQPKHDLDLGAMLAARCSIDSMHEAILFVRSILAQTLLGLEAAQYHLRFTHYDLHMRNVMCDYVTSRDPERLATESARWQYVRPAGRGVMRLVPSDSDGYAARIIDLGRARMDHPRYPGSDARASYVEVVECAPCRKFDTSVDMRALAYDLVIYGLASWSDIIAEVRHEDVGARAPAHDEFNEMMDVLEAMAGISGWNGLNAYVSTSSYALTTECDGEKLLGITSLAELVSIYRSTNPPVPVRTRIRADQFIMRRPVEETRGTPTDVLAMPFFDTYRLTPNANANEDDDDLIVVPVADASLSPMCVVEEAVEKQNQAHARACAAALKQDGVVTPVGSPVVSCRDAQDIVLTQSGDAITAEGSMPGSSKKRRY